MCGWKGFEPGTTAGCVVELMRLIKVSNTGSRMLEAGAEASITAQQCSVLGR